MHGSMSEKKDQEERGTPLNNEESDSSLKINRGVELLLRNKNRSKQSPKTFQLKFGKIVSFYSTEVDFFFNFHLDFKKISSKKEE